MAGTQNWAGHGTTRQGRHMTKYRNFSGLGYPGGPVIDRLAYEGNPVAIDFPRAYLPDGLDFSFSGLKTAVSNFLRRGAGAQQAKSEIRNLDPGAVRDVCASFQQAVVDVLVRKTEWAVRKENIKRVAVSGGVGANTALRRELAGMAEKDGLKVFIPPVALCTDNAAMIAAAGYHHLISRDIATMDLNPAAYLPL